LPFSFASSYFLPYRSSYAHQPQDTPWVSL
jgi:hypothetical protein